MSQKDWATEWDSASCFFTENKFKQGQEKVKVTKIKWEQNQNGALTLTKIIERRSLRFFTAVFDYFSLFNFCEFLFEEGSVNKQVFARWKDDCFIICFYVMLYGIGFSQIQQVTGE